MLQEQTLKTGLGAMPVIKLSNWKLALFSVIFIALSVFTPWLTHQFGIAGAIFLPMHFFVLTAALLFGWQAGLIVGIATPLVSYLASGMPMITMLPQITIEVAIYGLTAGWLREKLNLNFWISLIGAMIIGRLALGLAALALSGTDPLVQIQNVVKAGWPGILIQLMLIPILIKSINKKITN